LTKVRIYTYSSSDLLKGVELFENSGIVLKAIGVVVASDTIVIASNADEFHNKRLIPGIIIPFVYQGCSFAATVQSTSVSSNNTFTMTILINYA
jgi:hypothetical protein